MADEAGEKTRLGAKGNGSKQKEVEAKKPESAAEPMDTSEAPPAGSGSQQDVEGTEAATCYCGDPRELGTVELMCGSCLGWFHANCVSSNIGKAVPFMTCYQFYCKTCSQTGQDSFQKRQATFSQMCHAALANLTFKAEQEGETAPTFSKEMDIIPYIDKNWESLTTSARRVKLTWHNTVYKTLTKEAELFHCTQEDGSDAYFTLVLPDLSKIAPSYDKGAAAAAQGFVDTKSRSAKRKGPFDSQPQGNKQKRNELGTGTKLPPHGYPLEHPFNKDGYRYYLAESDPHAPNRQAFDESVEWAGKPIPGYLYRVFLGNQVYLSMHDRATQLKLSDDRLTVTGEKGYSMLRASHGVTSGQWYFEVTVDEMPEPTATRIGWSQALGNLQAPCGYDKFSYSWRSRKGTRFHQSRGYHYCDGGYGEGDTLGFFISLPLPEDREKWLPQTFKDRPLVKFKNHLYFEEKDCVSDAEKALKPAVGSKMIMYKNGESQGVAFEDIFEGTYYPAISLYKAATVTINFGPDFKHPPSDQKYQPMSEAANQAMVESSLADSLYHIDNEGKLPEF